MAQREEFMFQNVPYRPTVCKTGMQPCSSQIQDYGTISMQLTSIWKNKTKNTILDKLHIILRFQKTIKQVPAYYLKGPFMFFYPDFIAILFWFYHNFIQFKFSIKPI